MENKELEEVINTMLELNIATGEEIELITYINGYNMDALNDIIYIRTGYRNIEQVLEETEE